MKEAKFIKNIEGWRGDAKLYALSESLEGYSHVIVSGIHVLGEPETYIFPANEKGECLDWGELDGSLKGDIDHKQVLENAGYTVVE